MNPGLIIGAGFEASTCISTAFTLSDDGFGAIYLQVPLLCFNDDWVVVYEPVASLWNNLHESSVDLGFHQSLVEKVLYAMPEHVSKQLIGIVNHVVNEPLQQLFFQVFLNRDL
uniref:Uncharacterized protein n=1 Tax=Staphylothermus marinus TaxID=2280 RepID=A0A7J3KGI2_STAMA